MFRDDRQKCAVIRVLLRHVGQAELWSETGPTADAIELLAARGGPLSHGQAVMLRVAFDIWGGDGHIELNEIMSTLDPDGLLLVGTLLTAVAHEASGVSVSVDAWLSPRQRA